MIRKIRARYTKLPKRVELTNLQMISSKQIQLLRLLLARLERVSADSYWAHRASGVRGGLLRMLEKLEAEQTVDESALKRLMDKGFQILEQAAYERTK